MPTQPGNIRIGAKDAGFQFDASAQTITFNDKTLLLLGTVVLIRNVTDGITIYDVSNVNLGGAIAENVLTLAYNTTSMADDDQISVEIAPFQSVGGPVLRKMLTALQQPAWPDGAPVSVANNAYLDLRPALAGDEIRIESFAYGGNVELWRTNGVNPQLIDSFTGPASSTGYTLHSTRTLYYRLKNVGGGAAFLISADGVYTTKV
jgi:hypothetical protein